MKKLIFLLPLLFLLSCKDNSLFIKFYDDSFKGKVVKQISYKTDNYYLLDKVQRAFEKAGFKTSTNDAKYHIVLTSHYVISCKNPVVHALGADFNGFIRLSFFDKGKEVYRIQKDFKSKVTNSMIDKIVKRLIKDLKIKPAF